MQQSAAIVHGGAQKPFVGPPVPVLLVLVAVPVLVVALVDEPPVPVAPLVPLLVEELVEAPPVPEVVVPPVVGIASPVPHEIPAIRPTPTTSAIFEL